MSVQTPKPRRRLRLPLRERPASHVPGRPFMVAVGLLGIGALLLMFWIGYNAPNNIPFQSTYNLHAYFNDADNLSPHGQVRLAGRLVGQILHPRVEHGLAEVDLQLYPSVEPLLSDTTLVVRPRSPIGVRYIQLIPGTHGRPLKDGASIPASNTSTVTDLDTVLDTLDTPRRAEAQTVLNQLGAGAVGRGLGLNDTIGRAPSFLRDLQSVSAAVNATNGGPQRLIAGSQAAAAAADPVRGTIASGWEPEAQAMQPFYTHGAGLRAALDAAPPTLAEVHSGLAQTDPLLTQVTGFAAELQPTLRNAPANLTQASRLLRVALPGLRQASLTLDLAQRATGPTLTLLSRLSPVLPTINAAMSYSTPMVDAVAPRECDYAMFARNWASMLGFGDASNDGLGSLDMLRFNLQGDEESIMMAGQKGPAVNSQPYPAPCQARSQP